MMMSGGFQAEIMMYLMLGVLFIGMIFQLLHILAMLKTCDCLGEAYNASEVSDHIRTIRNVYIVNIILALLSGGLEIGSELRIIAPLDSSVLITLDLISTAIGIYFAYIYFNGFKFTFTQLDEVYKKNPIIGTTPEQSNDPTELV